MIALLLIASSAILLVENTASWIRSGYQWVLFFEHTAQVLTPFLLYLWVFRSPSFSKFMLGVKWIVAITFTCHGLYALGIPYGQPDHFITMTIRILGVEAYTASVFLVVAGLMDIAISVGIFFKPTARISMLYAIVWGLLTAFARIVAFVEVGDLLMTSHQWVYQAVYRFPHALLPLALWQLQTYVISRKDAVAETA